MALPVEVYDIVISCAACGHQETARRIKLAEVQRVSEQRIAGLSCCADKRPRSAFRDSGSVAVEE